MFIDHFVNPIEISITPLILLIDGFFIDDKSGPQICENKK